MNNLARLFVWSGTRPRPSVPRVTPNAYGFAYEDVQIISAHEDGVKLSGWIIKPDSAAIGSVILCHGHTSTRSEMLKRAVLLRKHHFTTLLFDFRARGLSEGARCTLGMLEMWDVIGAVEFLKSRRDTQDLPMFVLGNSMGGAAAIFAAAQDPRIRAVVAEGVFASLTDVVKRRISFAAGPLAARVTDECARVGVSDVNLDIALVKPASVIARISPRPLLLITDGLDMTCPRTESDKLFEAAQEPKQRWIASAAPHISAFQLYPDLYERTIVSFLETAIKEGA